MAQTWSPYGGPATLTHEQAATAGQEHMDLKSLLVNQIVQQTSQLPAALLHEVLNSIASANPATNQFAYSMHQQHSQNDLPPHMYQQHSQNDLPPHMHQQHLQNDLPPHGLEDGAYVMDEGVNQNGPEKRPLMPAGMTLQSDPMQLNGRSSISQIRNELVQSDGDEQSIADMMKKMLLVGGLTHDICLIADDGEIPAHRYLLIYRSPYFECRLQGFERLDPWEAIPKQRVEGISVTILRHVLTFIYTDTCDFHIESATGSDITTCVELLDASIRFGLKGLEHALLQHVLGPLALILPDALQSRAQLNLMLRRTTDVSNREDARRSIASSNAAPQADPFETSQTGFPLMLDEVLNDSAQPGQSPDDNQGVDQSEIVERIEKLASTIRDSGATTLMIRNLPRHVKQRRFIKELDDSGFAGTYDYAYLPSSFGNGSEPSGLGYAFVNFDDLDAITRFVKSWHGTCRFKMAATDMALTVTAAEHQGKEVNVRMWLRKGGRVRNPDLRPFVKEGGQLIGQDSRDDYQSFVEQLISYMPGLRSMNSGVNANLADDTSANSAEGFPTRPTGTARFGIGIASDRDSFQ